MNELSEEHKRHISEGQAARHLRNIEAEVAQPDHKRCSGPCGKLKRVPEDFYMRKRRLKCGATRFYPNGECKECAAARTSLYKEKLRKEGTLSDRQKKWNKSRDPKALNKYHREWGRIRRALDGATPRGPWKKYRDELEDEEVKIPKVQEFVDWYFRLKKIKHTELLQEEKGAKLWNHSGAPANSFTGVFDFDGWSEYIGLDRETAKQFERTLKRESAKLIPLDIVDTVLYATNSEHLLAIWWPKVKAIA